MVRSIGGVQAAFSANKGHREVGFDGYPAQCPSGVGMEAGGNIHRYDLGGHSIEGADGVRILTLRGPVEAGTEQGIDDKIEPGEITRRTDIQRAALDALYALEPLVHAAGDRKLLEFWRKLQTSDHFYYMCTKYWADGDVHQYFSPYDSPYDGYINFMNVLDNVKTRVAQL